MIKRMWFKCAALTLSGTVLGIGFGNGCLQATVQRILVAVAFD